MAPVIVFDRASGAPVYALGSPGGANIIDYVAEALVALLDWNLEPGGSGGPAACDQPQRPDPPRRGPRP